MTLDTVIAGSDPVRDEVGCTGIACRLFGTLENQRPQVLTGLPGRESCFAMRGGNVAPYGMPLVPVDTPLSLLKVNRVTGEVPMH